ncbi:MAG: Rpp14/Pop5 family protein [Candidatus Bathyarchaeia archaeon]
MRKRYLLAEVISDEPTTRDDFAKSLFSNLLALYGEYGASKANLRIIDFNESDGQALLSCSNDSVHMLHSVLASMKEIAHTPAIVRSVHVSGTLKSLRKKTSRLRK